MTDEAAADDPLERAALEWVATYWNSRHLVRTRDWLLEIRPDAPRALQLAALTHDMERALPGGPRLDARSRPWDDPEYLAAHCERSAAVVAAWLRERRAPEALVGAVSELVLRHELGGTPEADLLQAADSISFLEVNGPLARRWVQDGRCDLPKAREKLDWMLDRIAIPQARALATPLYERAVVQLDETAGRP